MSPPHPLASIPPPLPPGWTEHVGPSGQIYFFNTTTRESTYVRPLPALPATAPKKEKPKIKTPIPGTDWLKVTTTLGNVFYTNKAKKQSVWTVPDEIKDAVELLNKQEEEDKIQEGTQPQANTRKDAEAEQAREIERVRMEVQEVVKRKAEDVSSSEDVVISKKPRVEDQVEGKAEVSESTDDDEESEEEEWQREAAAQLAKEAEEEEKTRQEEIEKAKEAQKLKESVPQLPIPDRVDLSIEEGKALFKTLLREKDINPLHPWDMSLPLFISDPRYVLLPSVAARREAFDEYCRERARELRASRVKKEENPKDEFEKLLATEVKSTRTSWTDFRRQWKKDRRFYGWGRDDREREKRFREFIKDLAEKKRALAQKAEADFFALLRESDIAHDGAVWTEVKKTISDDPRYDAVGSSSLRAELFNTFLNARSNQMVPDEGETQGTNVPSSERGDDTQKRKDRKTEAVKEREEKVRAERERVQATIERSRSGLNREEGELQFRTLLTDAIREPQASWDSSLAQLQTDPRFQYSSLTTAHQRRLFEEHVSGLRAKHSDSLHALFLSHSPSLATEFSALPVTSLLSSLPATKLGFDVYKLEKEFDRWQRTRTTDARKAFDDMLHENSFVEFWGRLGKLGGEGVNGGVQRDDGGDEEEGEGGGGNVDMKKLAKSVDITEMEKVLKSDKRYIMFDHVPEQRERWLRVYLAQLSAPKLSVHV